MFDHEQLEGLIGDLYWHRGNAKRSQEAQGAIGPFSLEQVLGEAIKTLEHFRAGGTAKPARTEAQLAATAKWAEACKAGRERAKAAGAPRTEAQIAHTAKWVEACKVGRAKAKAARSV